MKKLVLALFAGVALVPAAAMAQQMPIRVGGNIKAPERVSYVAPEYPAVAQSARVSGVVIIEATLGPEGNVVDAHVIRSIALLDQAAVDAVKQWKYTPTTMNGMAVPVIMTVTVNFTLQGAPNPATSSEMSTGDFDAGHPLMPQQSSEPVTLNGKPAIRVGGDTKAPERTKYVAPWYPEIAQSARISGIVVLEAVIDENGRVATARVLRSVPLLDQAAIDAVLQWEYAPTLLNGVPVPVVMTVTVNFTLQ